MMKKVSWIKIQERLSKLPVGGDNSINIIQNCLLQQREENLLCTSMYDKLITLWPHSVEQMSLCHYVENGKVKYSN